MRRIMCNGSVLLAATFLSAAGAAEVPPSPVIAAVAEPAAIPLYGTATPGQKSTEIWFKWYDGNVISVRNVTYPTLTPVLPAPGKATGAAVIVAPGGAFEFLSMEHEGWAVARALADHGITAFVLKYRLKPTAPNQAVWVDALMRNVESIRARNVARMRAGMRSTGPDPGLQFPAATADALAALSLVRANAGRWNIDAKRVGMIGFSAGAAAVLDAMLTAKPNQAPAYAGLIYGPLERVPVPAGAPPVFAALAMNDPLFSDFSLVSAWHEAGRPVELHLYQEGGHGFGLGRAGTTNALMIDEFVAWLAMQGFTRPSSEPRQAPPSLPLSRRPKPSAGRRDG